MSRKMDKMISDYENWRLLADPMNELRVLIERINKAINVSQIIIENHIEGDIIIRNDLLEQIKLVKIKAEEQYRALQEIYSECCTDL